MKRFFTWRTEWVYPLAFTFLFGAAALRGILTSYNQLNVLIPGVLILAAWLALFLILPAIERRWRVSFYFYLVFQSALTFILMLFPEPTDYFAVLYCILSMQIVQRLPIRPAMILIAVFTPLTFIAIARNIGIPAAIPLTAVYLAGNALLAAYADAARRALKIREQNQVTLVELQEANRQLASYSKQLEQLTVARERGRLARELHDSVTQSIFSMTLTTQSAILLLERDPARVGEQLARLNELAQGALAEMQTLISELSPQKITEGGLADALRRHLTERHLPDSLSVSLDVSGKLELPPAEAQGLFRIAQEALNNIVKHSGASRVNLRLHLSEPFWMEIEDNGYGFDLRQARQASGVGLHSMRERSAEIGWNLKISSSPGSGTRIRLEKIGSGAQDKLIDSSPEYQTPDTQLPNPQSPSSEKEGQP